MLTNGVFGLGMHHKTEIVKSTWIIDPVDFTNSKIPKWGNKTLVQRWSPQNPLLYNGNNAGRSNIWIILRYYDNASRNNYHQCFDSQQVMNRKLGIKWSWCDAQRVGSPTMAHNTVINWSMNILTELLTRFFSNREE